MNVLKNTDLFIVSIKFYTLPAQKLVFIHAAILFQQLAQ